MCRESRERASGISPQISPRHCRAATSRSARANVSLMEKTVWSGPMASGDGACGPAPGRSAKTSRAAPPGKQPPGAASEQPPEHHGCGPEGNR